jgi:AcrR family transcriptional regulator
MGEEQQRARIERAMAEEMAVRADPHLVGVADVLARAGVSRRAFHELYADREACFLAAFEQGLALAGEAMYTAYSREARWADGVRAALAALLALLDREPALARLCVVYAPAGGARVQQRRQQAIAVLCEYVDRGRLEGAGRSEPPEVTAEGVVGAVLAVIHTRLVGNNGRTPPLSELLGPLMHLILLPYLGAARAGRELDRGAPPPDAIGARGGVGGVEWDTGGVAGEAAGDGMGAARDGTGAARDTMPTGAGVRLTYRTARVLQAIGLRPRASNREVADQAGIVDQGQISRLLRRLERLGLVENVGEGADRGSATRGTANAWVLTPRGRAVSARAPAASPNAPAGRSSRPRRA